MNASLRMHPLLVIAATAVILTCLLAIAVMTGVVPSPLTRDRGVAEQESPPPQAAAPAGRTARTPEARVGTTSSDPPYRTVAGSGPTVAPPPPPVAVPAPAVAPPPPVVCDNCGTVTSVRVVRKQGQSTIVGPLAGGAIGGVVGNQIGSGSGRTAATIVGAAGGAVIGSEVERRSKTTSHYVVGVRLTDGTTRRFTYGSAPAFREGDGVKVVEGRLVRDS